MKKRVLILTIFLLVLVGGVLGIHTKTLIVNNNELYESLTKQFNILIQKSSGDDINKVIFNIPLAFSLESYSNIDNLLCDKINDPTNTTLVCNGNDNLNEYYLNLKANLVGTNSTETINVITEDVNGGSVSNLFTIKIVDDSKPPILSNPIPQTGDFVPRGLYTFSIQASDIETGIKSGTINYDYDDVYTSGSGLTNSADLVCVDGMCSQNLNLVYDPLHKYLEFKFSVYDNADNIKTLTQSIRIDNDIPVITSISPDPGTGTNSDIPFQFTASDESFVNTYIEGGPTLNPTLDCTLDIGSGLLQQNIILNDIVGTKSITPDLSTLLDGVYIWFITCIDKADWIGVSETRTFILDTTGPEIILNSPSNNSIIAQGTPIDLSIIDISGVASASYEDGAIPESDYDIDTTAWLEGERTITVTAVDGLGNTASRQFTFTKDLTQPIVELITPLDNEITDGNVDFIFNATDNFATSLNCDLYIDEDIAGSIVAQSGKNTIINPGPAPSDGRYDWFVSCRDSVALQTDSITRTVIVDTTPPAITITSPANNSNNINPGSILFQYTPTELNGIASCSLHINGEITEDIEGLWYNPPSSNDPYPWYITCTDMAGNIGLSGNYTLYRDDIVPVISNIINSSDSSTATITWDTLNEFSNSTVIYSTDQLNLNSKIQESTSVKQHTLSLTSLSATTIYYYQIFSTDQWGNVGNSAIYNFTTAATPPSGGGGGGGSNRGGGGETTIICKLDDYACGAWGECQGTGRIGSQSRTCELKEGISCTDGEQPISLRECALLPLVKEEEQQNKPGKGLTSITGFSILDNLKSTPAIAVMISALVILSIAAFYRWLKGKGNTIHY